MSITNADQNKPFGYDVASISHSGTERRNYVRDALIMDKDQKASANLPGQFVRVFADIFLKKEHTGTGNFK